MEKEWRPIPRFEERYLCSEYGDVFSLYSGREISNRMSSNGYIRVNLYLNAHHRTANVHTLVAETFLGKRPKGMQVNHIDGVKTNNHASNLEYVTPKENLAHAVGLGLYSSVGESNPSSKLTEDEVLDIYKTAMRGDIPQEEIAIEHSISESLVSAIKTGRVWGYLTGIMYTPKHRNKELEGKCGC